MDLSPCEGRHASFTKINRPPDEGAIAEVRPIADFQQHQELVAHPKRHQTNGSGGCVCEGLMRWRILSYFPALITRYERAMRNEPATHATAASQLQFVPRLDLPADSLGKFN